MPEIHVFDRTYHETHVWLNHLMEELEWDDKPKAYKALRVTLQALRDRLSPEEAADLGAQLPMLIRGFYYEGWKPAGKPLRIRHKDDFLEPIQTQFSRDVSVDPEAVARGVFSVVAKHVTGGEIEDVKQSLPKELRSLWPEAQTV